MKYLILLQTLILFSCKPSYDCDSTAEDFKIDECILVVQKTPSLRDNMFDYEGINPITKKSVIVIH